MARIKQKDLEHLSDSEIREIYLFKEKDLNKLPDSVRNYVIGKDGNNMQRLMRIKSLLQQIMINRFVFSRPLPDHKTIKERSKAYANEVAKEYEDKTQIETDFELGCDWVCDYVRNINK